MLTQESGKKSVEYHLSLRYPVQLTKQVEDDEEYWLAEILDLPGCMSHGDTPDEAMDNIEDAKRAWIETHLEDGYEVPEPSDPRGYSGRLVLRMPKSLHRALAHQAKREQVSLNQLIVSLLAGHSRQSDLMADLGEIARGLGASAAGFSQYRVPAPRRRRAVPGRAGIADGPPGS